MVVKEEPARRTIKLSGLPRLSRVTMSVQAQRLGLLLEAASDGAMSLVLLSYTVYSDWQQLSKVSGYGLSYHLLPENLYLVKPGLNLESLPCQEMHYY